MRNIVILGGSSHPDLVARICHNINVEPGDATLKKFSNGETSITIKDSVREKDVYVIQSSCGSVNDSFIELLIMISACKTASAKKVTAVLPLFPYSRQPDAPYERKARPSCKKGLNNAQSQVSSPSSPNPPLVSSGFSTHNTGYREWVAQPGSLVASLLTCAGANHIITMDLHDPQFQGYFDIPVDNLYGRPLLQHYIVSSIPNYLDAVIVSPDAGGAKRATAIADSLGMPFALIHKERRRAPAPASPQSFQYPTNGASNQSTNNNTLSLGLVSKPGLSSVIGSANSSYTNLAALSRSETYGVIGGRRLATTMLVGNVRDRVAILIDDLLDTASTITRAAKLLKDQGATKVYALITHGIFSGDAAERILNSAIDKIITTNTTPQDEHSQILGDKLEVLDVSRVFGEAIRRIHNGESVSMLFDHGY